MTCYCCGSPLVRAADIPDARWLRNGDRYCAECERVIPREQLTDGWPAARRPCGKHSERAAEV